jgi:hypothetical protein
MLDSNTMRSVEKKKRDKQAQRQQENRKEPHFFISSRQT